MMTGDVEQKRRRSLFNQAFDVLCILLGIRDDAVVHHQIARATGIERCLVSCWFLLVAVGDRQS